MPSERIDPLNDSERCGAVHEMGERCIRPAGHRHRHASASGQHWENRTDPLFDSPRMVCPACGAEYNPPTDDPDRWLCMFDGTRLEPADDDSGWLTCECCGSTDDETTNGRECEDDEYVNLCDSCVAILTSELPDA